MKITFDTSRTVAISPNLYGLFFEDINFSIDGGMNSNQIANPRFGFRRRLVIKNLNYRLRFIKKQRKRIRYTEQAAPLNYWSADGQTHISALEYNASGAQTSYCMQIQTAGGRIYNPGYGHGEDAVGVKMGGEYIVKLNIGSANYSGSIKVYAASDKKLTESAEFSAPLSGTLTATVKAIAEGIGKFVIEFVGKGELKLEYCYFGDKNAVGEGDPRYSAGKFRRDLVDALRELKPTFIRFPGGCIVEGYSTDNSYYWKYTVGALAERRQQINLWGNEKVGYMQGYEIGFYEYFLLCEELNAEPMPIVNAGLACQGRTFDRKVYGDPAFNRYIQDAVDLVDFARGDAAKGKWAALRAKMGHPDPFKLNYMGIGNENWGEDYMKNFAAIKSAVLAVAPDMNIIWSAGFDCYKHPRYAVNRALFDGVHDDCIVDDHFYRKPQWCLEHHALYDDYNGKARIFLGEYAANNAWDDKAQPNNYLSALAEAAFMTGLERNADRVIMASYAPLFSRNGCEQWKHNLINFDSLYTLKTANYYVQRFFSASYGANYVPCGNAENGVYRSATTNGKELFIKLVNTNREAVSLTLCADGADGKAKQEYIACDDDYAKNTIQGKPCEPISPIMDSVTFVNGETAVQLKPRSVNVITAKIVQKQ